MRTQQEIIERIEEIHKEDRLGFGHSALVDLLDFEHARPFLKDSTTAEDWDGPEEPIQAIKDYMKFAWEKAMGERGISAYRSLAKIEQWAWASGDDELMALVNSNSYGDYGKRQLANVCRHLNIESWQEWAKPSWLD